MKKYNQRGRPKGIKNKFQITCEILPPGSLKRTAPTAETPEGRWEEIINIGSEIIEESKN